MLESIRVQIFTSGKVTAQQTDAASVSLDTGDTGGSG